MTPKQQGATAFNATPRIHFEANPFLNDHDRASRCLTHTWPENAREWHRGWSEAATALADRLQRGRK
jgi:hypothetical protein